VNARNAHTARNEDLFREVNERIEELTQQLDVLPSNRQVEFHCECGRDGCDARLSMTIAEYDAVRTENDRFAVAPGHESGDLERVVERNERYLVVDKLPAAEPLSGS
jgi:hypothetical protein